MPRTSEIRRIATAAIRAGLFRRSGANLLTVITAITAACSDATSPGTGGGGTPGQPAVASVAVSPGTATLTVGDNFRITAQALDGAGRALEGRAIQYAASDTTIATVTAAGVVTAVRVGALRITASSEGKSGFVEITVEARTEVPRPAPRVTGLSPNSVVAGWPDAVTVTVTGAGFIPQSRVYSNELLLLETHYISATELRVRLEKSYLAAPSTMMLSVENPSPGGGVSASVEFRVMPVPVAQVRVENSLGAPWVWSGDRTLYVAKAFDHAGRLLEGRGATFESTNTAVATVTTTGVVRGVSPGVAQIVATVDGVRGELYVRVIAAPEQDIIFDGLRNGVRSLYMYRPGTGESPSPIAVGRAWDPTPSPDGTRIAYVAPNELGVDIYVVTLAGMHVERLTHDGRNDEPAWSPDGSRIAFRSMRGGWSDIWVMNADGTNPQNLTDMGDTRIPETFSVRPSWSPDSRRIAYAHSWTGMLNIIVMNADGTGKRELRRTYDSETEPTWSADGLTITFTQSVRDELPRLVEVLVADGTEIHRPNTPATGWQAAASRDHWVAYTDADDNGTRTELRVVGRGTEAAWMHSRVLVEARNGGGTNAAWMNRRR